MKVLEPLVRLLLRMWLDVALSFFFSLSYSSFLADNYYCISRLHASAKCVLAFAGSTRWAPSPRYRSRSLLSRRWGSRTPIKMRQGRLPQGRPENSSRNSCILNRSLSKTFRLYLRRVPLISTPFSFPGYLKFVLL